jgi:hypothetical protein
MKWKYTLYYACSLETYAIGLKYKTIVMSNKECDKPQLSGKLCACVNSHLSS